MDPFAVLPPELCLKILGKLPDFFSCMAASVCRVWYFYARDDIVWWKSIVENRYGSLCKSPIALAGFSIPNADWGIYKCLFFFLSNSSFSKISEIHSKTLLNLVVEMGDAAMVSHISAMSKDNASLLEELTCLARMQNPEFYDYMVHGNFNCGRYSSLDSRSQYVTVFDENWHEVMSLLAEGSLKSLRTLNFKTRLARLQRLPAILSSRVSCIQAANIPVRRAPLGLMRNLDTLSLKNNKSISAKEFKSMFRHKNVSSEKMRVKLKTLDLSGNPQLGRFPDIVSTFSNLVELSLANNNFAKIPTEFSELPVLRNLNLSFNNLNSTVMDTRYLPSSICDLDLSYNDIENIPSTFRRLNALRVVNLSVNSIAVLPLHHLPTSISVLRAHRNCINEISCKDMYVLPYLVELELRCNQIDSFPGSIGFIVPNVVSIRMDDNLIQTLPESFSRLFWLRNLHLENNSVSSLPETFGELQSLSVLVLEENCLTSLPPSFCKLGRLVKLNLEENKLTHLPELFGRLRCLTHLSLWNNHLEHLPDSFCGLRSLQTLNLKNNSLKQLPVGFSSSMVNLRDLLLGGNALDNVDDLVNLPRLVYFEADSHLNTASLGGFA